MALGTMFLTLLLSLILNIIVTSFLILRAQTSKKITNEVEATLTELIHNVNQATSEQIILAEESIKKLKSENARVSEVFAKFSQLNIEKYKMLLDCLKIIEKKKLYSLLLSSDTHSVKDRGAAKPIKSASGQELLGNKSSQIELEEQSTDLQKALSHDEIDLLKL